ncbi:hypothetical protein GYMLUDRAFT_233298 [Collybiopsis luxurians FD-317 M1]|uniref:F-box domain-containing protein n=1 Tax=Collybiopsis luxurians FD-317 M1 TaxID=944289 RepID=A0A0D0CCS1_9AGAR|nr:hypothetical protein GYMLUDRAFT_233298 [Collybiopsis luxurians FD-317 M1]
MLLLSDRDLEDYESEIARLQTQLVYVEAQRERLRDYRTKLRSLRSPIRRIPNEVLSRIFEFAYYDSHSPIKDLPTFAISAVCMRWRSFALSSPALWSRLSWKILSSNAPTDEFPLHYPTLSSKIQEIPSIP